MAKKKRRDYSFVRLDDLPAKVETRDRKIIRCEPVVDYEIFRKTEGEKLRLKKAKKEAKLNNDL